MFVDADDHSLRRLGLRDSFNPPFDDDRFLDEQLRLGLDCGIR